MILLYDAASGVQVGALTDDQFQVLVEALEEESLEDRDYYINRATLDLLVERGAGDDLLKALSAALGDREEMDLRWEREKG